MEIKKCLLSQLKLNTSFQKANSKWNTSSQSSPAARSCARTASKAPAGTGGCSGPAPLRAPVKTPSEVTVSWAVQLSATPQDGRAAHRRVPVAQDLALSGSRWDREWMDAVFSVSEISSLGLPAVGAVFRAPCLTDFDRPILHYLSQWIFNCSIHSVFITDSGNELHNLVSCLV